MIPRIKSIKALPDLILEVVFDDGYEVLYDVKEDLGMPGFGVLSEIPGMFENFVLDESRSIVSWSKEVDLPSHALYEYGKPIART